MPDVLTIEKASPAETADALSLVYAHLPTADRRSLVERLLREPDGAPRQSLWVARRDGPLVAAMRVQVQPGRTAIVSPPRCAEGEPAEASRQLLAAVLQRLSADGVQLAQSLLESDSGPDATLLAQHQFRHVCELQYLVSVRGAFPRNEPRCSLTFVGYTSDVHARLAEIVRRTYVGSLDCPAIEGVRHIDDVLAGYQASGVWDPARWLLVRHGERDVGCLLLTDDPPNDQWELIYLGIVPEQRGHGWGLAAVRHAQWLTGVASRQRLVVAVDAANGPALAAYAAAGFLTWDQRSAFVRVF
jgi:mycothiol synthase